MEFSGICFTVKLRCLEIYCTGGFSAQQGNIINKSYFPIFSPRIDNNISVFSFSFNGVKNCWPEISSECEFNTQFEKKPNAISDPEYSIQVGIRYFAKCLEKANVSSLKDEKGIFLALQSYNYGIGYMNYVEQTDKQYTYQNAIDFSEKCKKDYNVSVYGDSKYVYHVLRYYEDTTLVDDWLELYR